MFRNGLKFLSVGLLMLTAVNTAVAGVCKNCLKKGDEIEVANSFKEIKDEKKVKEFQKYWQREIRMGQEEGAFYAFSRPVSDTQVLIVTQMQSDLTCNVYMGKKCTTKLIIRSKDNHYTVLSSITMSRTDDSLILKGVDGKFPIIKFGKLEYEYNERKKHYFLSANSPKPVIKEVLDPRGIGFEDDKKETAPQVDEKKDDNNIKIKPRLNRSGLSSSSILGLIKDIFGIKDVYAGECANGMVVPTTYKVTSGFQSERDLPDGSSDPHPAVDYGTPLGTTIPSIADGVVKEVHGGCESRAGSHLDDNCNYGYGNYMIITLSNGDDILYAHLSSISVNKGDTVSAGTPVALSGNSGRSTGPHLHFEVRIGGSKDNRVDPVSYLESCGAVAWDGTGAAPGEGSNSNDEVLSSRFQVENLPWYTGGDDVLSDERYKELFTDEDDCSAK